MHCLSSLVDNKPCLRSFGSESSPNCCCFVGHTWVTSPRNGLGWRCLFCWGSDYALYRFVLTLHLLPTAVFYALATRFSNTARLFYGCPLFGQDQTKADRILRNCFEGANMAPAPTRLPLLPAMPAYTMGGTDASWKVQTQVYARSPNPCNLPHFL